MSAPSPTASDRIGVGIVSADPSADDGLAAGMPSELFELVAFSDEGLPDPAEYDGPAAGYPDFNMLLEDEAVELVLVEGPVDRRRDFAVRALNAGRHVVAAQPFAESAVDATRVMKTALRAELVATADMAWRDDADLASLLAALAAENVASVEGVLAFRTAPLPDDAPSPPPSLLGEVGIAMLDQVHLLLHDDVKSVSAHVQRPAAAAPDDGFVIYLPLRGGGCAVARASRRPGPDLPTWLMHTPGMTFTAAGGRTTAVTSAGEARSYQAPTDRPGFWENLFAAIRRGEQLKCHPADIVKAMKLHEAALESAGTGEPVVV